MARWSAALLALLTLAGAAACAGPPSTGDVHGVKLNQSRNNVFILAREPSSTMQPTDLVNNFLQALTGDQKDPTFSVAQEYLTPLARSHWNPAGSMTKIVQYTSPTVETDQSPDHTMRPNSAPSSAPQATPAPTNGEVQTVVVKGSEEAEIDSYGFFQFVSQPASVTQQFSVKYLGAGTGWRIDSTPDFRMVNPDAFKRAYQTYQSALPVYLATHSAVPQMDQVYLTQDTGKVDYTYDALARAVLHGRYPSQNSGLSLATPVTVSANGVATVTLNPPPAGMTDIGYVGQALANTFRDASETQQLLSPTPLVQVDVTYAGCGAACRPENIRPQPPTTPTVYWVCPQQGQNTNAAIVSRQLSGLSGAPAVCPANGAKVASAVDLAGVQLAKDSPIAVKQTSDSAEVRTPSGATQVAVVEQDGSVVVFNDKNTDHHAWYSATNPANVTDLEWDPVDGSLWVVDNTILYRVQDPGPKGPNSASQESLAVPGGSLTRFKPSPDGLRAVVVNGPGNTPASAANPLPASMVTIDRNGDQPTISTDTVFQLLAGSAQTLDSPSVALQSVTDAAWADGRTVVLLGTQTDASTPKLYKVYLDGSQDSTISDPDDAQPAARHISAVSGVAQGHASLWTVSDAPGPNDPLSTVSYFKRSGTSDSFQEVGTSPVVPTLTAG